MKHQEIFDKAYHSLIDLYAGKPDLCSLNRFYSEKMILQESDYIRYFDLFGNIRRRAKELGEHIFVRDVADSSLIAYLLEATESNIDPNLPFEMNLHSVFLENIQLGVSRRFFKEAREMICNYMADKSIVTLKGDDDISLTRLCFLEKGENEDTVAPFKDNALFFMNTPHITLAPTPTLEKYREIEIVTGVKMDDACSGDMPCSQKQLITINEQVALEQCGGFSVFTRRQAGLYAVFVNKAVFIGNDARFCHEFGDGISSFLIAVFVDQQQLITPHNRLDRHNAKVSLGNDHIGVDLPDRCEQSVLGTAVTAVIVKTDGIKAVIKRSIDLLGGMYFCHLFSINEKWGFL